jgi:hypothetical protein
MSNLTDLVPVSSIPSLNANLSSATLRTMTGAMGAPREPLVDDDCRNDQASPMVARLLETRRMTPNFRLTGIKPALDSVEQVLAKVKAAHPELIDRLGTEGMICVRHRRPPHGSPSREASNHSWGTAVDFKLNDGEAPQNTLPNVPRWVAILVPFFNEAGWYSGIGFDDAMHFEVADETIRKWQHDGLLGKPEMDQPLVADGSSERDPSERTTGRIASGFAAVGRFFSRIFGRG